MKQPLVALYGPTSSGKTALSVELGLTVAERLGLTPVVVSADSRQVYRGMDIGTSTTTPEEMRGIRHTMIDVADPATKLELEGYVELAERELERAWSAGELPMIVGGTGTYVAALLEGWAVAGTAAMAASVRRDFPPSMAADAHDLLRRLDPAAARRVHPANYEAVVNAIVAHRSDDRRRGPRRPAVVLGLDPGPGAVDRRIAETFDRQLAAGLLDEVLDLDRRYGLEAQARRGRERSSNQVLHTHGYREFFEVAVERRRHVADLRGDDLDEVRRRVVATIRAYSRRQRSWFRKLGRHRMVRDADEAVDAVVRGLRPARPRA